MKIKKAVIPVAGYGTRVLPATKSMPKEMYPIVDKPAIEYIVKEAVDSGITDILMVTTRGKEIIENHFDRSPELESALERSGKLEILETVKNISKMANIYFIRQKEARGLGDAILKAKNFVSGEPFDVLYGDDITLVQVFAQTEIFLDGIRKGALAHLSQAFRKIIRDKAIIIGEELWAHLGYFPTRQIEMEAVEEGGIYHLFWKW